MEPERLDAVPAEGMKVRVTLIANDASQAGRADEEIIGKVTVASTHPAVWRACARVSQVWVDSHYG